MTTAVLGAAVPPPGSQIPGRTVTGGRPGLSSRSGGGLRPIAGCRQPTSS